MIAFESKALSAIKAPKVEVKLETFPFTRFGLVAGRVRKLGRDAATPAPAAPGAAAPPAGAELAYPAKISLAQDWILVDGRREPIRPGMRVSAEIKTGERRVIEYLLSPVVQAVKEAGSGDRNGTREAPQKRNGALRKYSAALSRYIRDLLRRRRRASAASSHFGSCSGSMATTGENHEARGDTIPAYRNDENSGSEKRAPRSTDLVTEASHSTVPWG
jgi:hypothetical protein